MSEAPKCVNVIRVSKYHSSHFLSGCFDKEKTVFFELNRKEAQSYSKFTDCDWLIAADWSWCWRLVGWLLK